MCLRKQKREILEKGKKNRDLLLLFSLPIIGGVMILVTASANGVACVDDVVKYTTDVE